MRQLKFDSGDLTYRMCYAIIVLVLTIFFVNLP